MWTHMSLELLDIFVGGGLGCNACLLALYACTRGCVK